MRWGWMAALALTGCNAAESPAPVENASPTPIAATPTASAAPALTSQGWGPLQIGMTLAEVTAALGPDADPAAVGGPDPAACDEFRPADAPEGMLVMVEDGRLTRISLIDGATIRTARGIAIGDPAARVSAEYGADVATIPHEYSSPPARYMTVWESKPPAADHVVDPAARGLRYEIGDSKTVEAIRAGGPSIEYVEGCV